MHQNQTKIETHLKREPKFYVSITGLKVKSLLKIILFLRHAIPSKIQSDQAKGILFSEVKRINGIEHTLTAWENRKAMQSFLYSGAHARAIKAFRMIATGKTYGYETDRLPSWDEVHQIWVEKGKEY